MLYDVKKIFGIIIAVAGITGFTGMIDAENICAYSLQQDSIIYQSEVGEVVSGSAVTNSAVYTTGWNQVEEDHWIYADEEGQPVEKKEGWYLIQEQYIYLNEEGKQVTKKNNWYYINDKWHYIENGVSVTKKSNWYKISGKWHYILKNGKGYSGWKKISGKKYYFDKEGKLADGWFKAGKKEYYQTKKSGLFTLSVIKNKANGNYYYVDETGKKIDNKLTKLLVNVYRKTTNEKMSKEQKLRSMYMYLAKSRKSNKNVSYQRRYDDSKYIGKNGWTADYAYQILSSGKGNCYRFACAFGYFAKMLGYDSYVRVGQCTSTRGGYTPHCWVEIQRKNKATLVCDPELQFALGTDLYQKTYQTYPITVKKGKLYKIKF